MLVLFMWHFIFGQLDFCIIFLFWMPFWFFCQQRREVYGAWEQYLGIEHTDTSPKRFASSNQVDRSITLYIYKPIPEANSVFIFCRLAIHMRKQWRFITRFVELGPFDEASDSRNLDSSLRTRLSGGDLAMSYLGQNLVFTNGHFAAYPLWGSSHSCAKIFCI